MISGEIPQEALLSFTKDFWDPMSPTSTDKYFMIQKSDNPNGEVSPLIGRNPELFEILIGSNVQPSDFFEVSQKDYFPPSILKIVFVHIG